MRLVLKCLHLFSSLTHQFIRTDDSQYQPSGLSNVRKSRRIESAESLAPLDPAPICPRSIAVNLGGGTFPLIWNAAGWPSAI
jgi:hypothetical protein